MISRTPSLCRRSALEAKGSKLKALDEHINVSVQPTHL